IAGGFFWHMFRALRRSLGRVALWFFVTGLIAAVSVELIGIYESNGQLPSLPTHLAALALGIGVGYSASATLFVTEIIRDLFVTGEDFEKDIRNELSAGGRLVNDLVGGAGGGIAGSIFERNFERR